MAVGSDGFADDEEERDREETVQDRGDEEAEERAMRVLSDLPFALLFAVTAALLLPWGRQKALAAG